MGLRDNAHHARLFCSAAVFVMAGAAGTAQAQSRIDIPPQPLASALTAFSVQSDRTVIASTALTGAKVTQGVSGVSDPDVALRRMLEGTGLSYTRSDGAYMIVRADRPGARGAAVAAPESGESVEALIVTAQKREEDIQDVPIAISAFSQEDLTRSQVAGGPDLMTQVPNMTFTKTNFNSYSIQLRGIGTQAISATTDPAVAVAFNNTPFIRNHFFEQEFYDLQRIEVLRGPQGTLYGRNATAGVVNVISAKPKFFFEAKVAGDVANYSSSRLEGMVNIPLVEDKAALRIAGAWTKREGFVKNILTGEQTDGRDLWSGRVSLAIEPTDWFRADLIYEHFEEDDGRLRSGKQLCKKDPGPATVGNTTVPQNFYPLILGPFYLSQGCLPESMYSSDSFQTPNGNALAYYGPAASLGSPTKQGIDPYASQLQSRNLREIETHLTPDYEASADLVELQLRFDLSQNLSLTSETAFARDYIFSFQDFNRFDTTPDVFIPGGKEGVVDENGVFCDPQIGCTNRLAAADVATASSQQFSQELRLSSDYDGPFNFNLGANFLRYDTEDKYYVFINTLTVFTAGYERPWVAGETDNSLCFERSRLDQSEDASGYSWADPNKIQGIPGCVYIDPNNVHNLNDQGRNYFLSKNPYGLLSYSAFGELYYQIADNVKLTGGFRWTVDQKTAPQIPSWLYAAGTYGTPTRKVIERDWSEPTGRIAIDWKPELSFTDETLLYASYVRGYKAGGANPPPPVVVLYGVNVGDVDAFLTKSLTHPETFEPEFVNAYELGAKNTFLDGALTLNLGGFYYDYTGYQISQIVNRSAVNLNLDAAVWGIEVEADWRPLENLRLGFKGGYENTRLADGSSAVDLMDRTAGDPDWVLFKPFPPMPSNCVVPVWLVEFTMGSFNNTFCAAYLTGLDPITVLPYVENPTEYRNQNSEIIQIADRPMVGGVDLTNYPGFDPASAPNNGEGFAKDLSGNELPNAPDYTVSLTVDYTLPLPNEWLMTLHTDLYYQSEAWTRIFNTEGYDKLKAYTNVNFAAIFTNEDAGWNVMAYVKNVLDRDSITGAFLNSDDTGLTTNVFLTEPRLYGIRVTKQWTGGSPLGGLLGEHSPGEPYPFRLELGGYYGRFGQDHEVLAPATVALFPAEHPYPLGVQEDLDWGGAGGVRFTYTPEPGGWSFSGGVRYGRAHGQGGEHSTWAGPPDGYLKYADNPKYNSFGRYKTTFNQAGWVNYTETIATNEESHAIVDFLAGKEVGLGSISSTLSAGLRYAHFKSTSDVKMHGRPDLYIPPEGVKYIGARMHRFHADVGIGREFEGAGPAVEWNGSMRLVGDPEASGQWDLDVGLGGSILWGKQETAFEGEVRGEYTNHGTATSDGRFYMPGLDGEPTPYVTPFDDSRSRRVSVPSVDVSLGLSYDLGRTKVSGGYRWERYFDAVDGGIEERQTYDRDFHGPYFRVSVGFGG